MAGVRGEGLGRGDYGGNGQGRGQEGRETRREGGEGGKGELCVRDS